MRKFIDVSHTVEHGMVTYKGLPAPLICDFLSREASKKLYAPGTEFNIGKIEMLANTGTYIDSPFHRYAHGKDLSQLPLESLADLETTVVRAPFERGRAIDESAFAGHDLKGKAVLIHTGWSRNWRQDAYFEGHPYLTAAAADFLRTAGSVIAGIDTYNIDDTRDGARPVHTVLLGHDIAIVEHMTGLDAVPDHGARFFAVPVKVKDFGTFPVRAFCTCHDGSC